MQPYKLNQGGKNHCFIVVLNRLAQARHLVSLISLADIAGSGLIWMTLPRVMQPLDCHATHKSCSTRKLSHQADGQYTCLLSRMIVLSSSHAPLHS